MTKKGLSRTEVFSGIKKKHITKTEAAKILGMTFRHLHRLYKEFEVCGMAALGSKRHGKPSNNQLSGTLKAQILELIAWEEYDGFRPTFMCEKLKELHGITISVESTRKLMIQAGVWQGKRKRRPVVHQQRKRRAQFGELIQIDGSPHAWLEDRGDPCVLIAFIDDATGRAYGKFFPSETTEAYMKVAKEYIEKYGRPKAFYSDKYSVFRINKPGCVKKELVTQFGRACKELDIELICANSPQAKGRVERLNQTLQDRLIKEMRLKKVKSIEEANDFLMVFWSTFSEKFSVKPESKEDAHRKVTSEQDLRMIFCTKEERKVSKNLEISYENVTYQILVERQFNTIAGTRINVLKQLNGEIILDYNGKKLSFVKFNEQEFNGEIIESKKVNEFIDKPIKKVPYNHVWNQEGRAEQKRRMYQSL